MIRHEPGEFDDHPGPATDGVTGTGPRFGNRVHDDTGSLLGGRSAWHRRFGLCDDGLHERCIALTLRGGHRIYDLLGLGADLPEHAGRDRPRLDDHDFHAERRNLAAQRVARSEEHTSELPSLMRTSYA